MPPIDRITVLCFGASYACALSFEVWHQLRPRPILRVVSLAFGGAGILAHSLFILKELFLIDQPLRLASPFGSLVFLAWILSAFYLYGSLHHAKLAWGLFVLPLVLGLTVLASISTRAGDSSDSAPFWQSALVAGDRFWGLIHGILLLLAAVGVCVGFVASVMFLVQAYRLRAKIPPGQGVKLLNLERLEAMNRRAVTLAFPLLTAGLLVGVILELQHPQGFVSWTNPKLLSVAGLWLVFVILLYLRYAAHVRGRQVALWTIVAFALLVLALFSDVHPIVAGGGR